MDQHVTTEAQYYTSTQTVIPTPSSSSNLLYQQQQEPQYHVLSFSQPQQYMIPANYTLQQQPQPQQPQHLPQQQPQQVLNNGPYPSIDFFYETPQSGAAAVADYTTASTTAIPTNTNYQIPNVSSLLHIMSLISIV